MPEKIEYACRFTAWTNTDGRDRQVVKYDQTGTGERGLAAARTLAKQTRDWQPHHELPVDAVVVSRPVPEWTVVNEPETSPANTTTWIHGILACAVPDPEMPDGICGEFIESTPCPRHGTEST